MLGSRNFVDIDPSELPAAHVASAVAARATAVACAFVEIPFEFAAARIFVTRGTIQHLELRFVAADSAGAFVETQSAPCLARVGLWRDRA